jgi:hypothetical protein
MHTQLVAIRESYRHAVDLHYFHGSLRYRARPTPQDRKIVTITVSYKALVMFPNTLIGKVGGNLYNWLPGRVKELQLWCRMRKEPRGPGRKDVSQG